MPLPTNSLDGGAYTSSSSPIYMLPGNISTGQHTLTGYVTDNYGGVSQTATFTAFVGPPQVMFQNNGSGAVEVNGTILNTNNDIYTSTSATPLTVTLLTSGVSYDLSSNVAIDSLTAAAGVTDVAVTVTTNGAPGSPMLVGNGHIGSITLPGDGSTLSVTARGDVGSITGPTSNGTLSGLSATDLVFANLDGSITGVDSIQSLSLTGWLGTSAAQQVLVSSGIGSLSAYGVGATVHADLRQDAGDAAMAVSVGDGGVTGEIDGGNVSGVQVAGNVNVFDIGNLEGNFDPPNVNQLTVREANAASLVNLANAGTVLFDDKSPEKIGGIRATGNINTLEVNSDLTVSGDITAQSLGTIKGHGFLAGNNITTSGNIGDININGLNLGNTKDRQATKVSSISCEQLGAVTVSFNMTANIRAAKGVKSISVGGLVNANLQQLGTFGDFIGSVISTNGDVGPISVKGNFDLPTDAPTHAVLVSAPGVINAIEVNGNVGSTNSYQKSCKITGNEIQGIRCGGSILLSQIVASITNAKEGTTPAGSICGVFATLGTLKAVLKSIGGNIGLVRAQTIEGNITAETTNLPPWKGAKDWNPNEGGSIESIGSQKKYTKYGNLSSVLVPRINRNVETHEYRVIQGVCDRRLEQGTDSDRCRQCGIPR